MYGPSPKQPGRKFGDDGDAEDGDKSPGDTSDAHAATQSDVPDRLGVAKERNMTELEGFLPCGGIHGGLEGGDGGYCPAPCAVPQSPVPQPPIVPIPQLWDNRTFWKDDVHGALFYPLCVPILHRCPPDHQEEITPGGGAVQFTCVFRVAKSFSLL